MYRREIDIRIHGLASTFVLGYFVWKLYRENKKLKEEIRQGG